MTREGARSANDVSYESNRKFTIKIDKDGGSNPIYIGKAIAGTLTSQAFWQIFKITWDVSNDPTDVKWADSVTTFTKEWDERASYDFG
jgi:hypothetical protein